MLKELTQEQEKIMHQVWEEYLNKFFSCQKLNKEKATEWVKWLYRFSGLKEPKVIFVDSPLAAEYAVNMIVRNQVGNEAGNQAWEQIWEQIWGQVRDQVNNQVSGQVWYRVADEVESQVRNQIRSQVGDKAWEQVWKQLREQVCNQVGERVWYQVRNQAENQMGEVRNPVEKLKLQFYNFSVYGNVSDYGWASFYDFFTRIGIINYPDFNQYKKIIDTGIYDMIQLDELCVVCGMPEMINRDGQHRLHSENKPAIKWSDGYELYYLHGVNFPKDLWEKVTSRKMPFQEILEIKDIDQRRQALKYGDWDEFVKWQEAKKIDEYIKFDAKGRMVNYELWRFPYHQDEAKRLFSKEVCFARYLCPSVREWHISGVPNFNTCAEAMAWKSSNDEFSISPEEWEKLKPLENEA